SWHAAALQSPPPPPPATSHGCIAARFPATGSAPLLLSTRPPPPATCLPGAPVAPARWKDEGGRRKEEAQALWHPPAFRLHPCLHRPPPPPLMSTRPQISPAGGIAPAPARTAGR